MSRNAPKRVLISTQPMCQRTRRVSTGVIGLSTNLHGSAASSMPLFVKTTGAFSAAAAAIARTRSAAPMADLRTLRL